MAQTNTSVSFTWDDTFLAQCEEQMARNIDKAAEVIVAEMKDVVGVQGSRGNHSPPGYPPYRQSGELQASIVARRTGPNEVTVEAEADHAKYVSATRPFIPWTMGLVESRVEAILREGF